MNPLISVIVPVYRVEKYIHKCVDSIINQIYENLEIILVDDGSPDNCPQICDEYAKRDSRIKVIHKENGGQGSARNMALDICCGEYISFVDSDDWIINDMIELMYREIEKNAAQLAICGIKSFNGLNYISNTYYTEIVIFNNEELIKEYVSKPTIHDGPCNKLYYRELFRNIRFPNIRAREDAYIMHEVLAGANKSVYIPECKYVQYVRSGSTEKSRFNPNKLALLECAELLQNFIRNRYPDLYKYVELKLASEIVVIMTDIIESFTFIKYRTKYIELCRNLSKEVELLKMSSNRYSIDHMIELEFISKHKIIFFIYSFCKGILRLIKRVTISILIRILHRYKR